MKIVGLTGGIGMGKSTAEQWLHRRGVAVVDTDVLAREIVEPGSPALEEIRRAFGEELIDRDGRLRRDELASIVFQDPVARQTLERITHPRIGQRWKNQIETWRQEGRSLGVVVVPLLFEIGAEKEFEATICVACSQVTQRRRLLERGWNDDQIQQRNAAQWPIEKKIARANFVVWTEGGLEILEAQLNKILGVYFSEVN